MEMRSTRARVQWVMKERTARQMWTSAAPRLASIGDGALTRSTAMRARAPLGGLETTAPPIGMIAAAAHAGMGQRAPTESIPIRVPARQGFKGIPAPRTSTTVCLVHA
jgi:hypothetical protein